LHKQTLFAGVVLLIASEDYVKEASQPSRCPVIQADKILPSEGGSNLILVR
jgi:hypothetical protein